jgi:hypothetical protein
MPQRTVASLAIGVACLAAPGALRAVEPLRVTGAIVGTVKDPRGVPQLGAAVQLYNRQDHPIARVLTDERGEFKLLDLLPNIYSIKVSIATLISVTKKDIQVLPGMRSTLTVNMNSLFSTIQLGYPTMDNGGIMSDDWKWVLRSASATRPVLRFIDPADALEGKPTPSLFSGTHAIVKVSGGEGAAVEGTATQADLGTAFALATAVYGNSELHVSGNLGYGSATGAPAAAFRTSYSRSLMGANPEVSVTMRQLYLPGRLGAAFTGTDSAIPALRTLSASLDDHARLAENVNLQYGASLDCVSFVDHLNYFSPYARLTYDIGEGSSLEFTYTSGNARPDLAGSDADNADLQRDLNSLGLFPLISVRNGATKVQRGNEYEVSYSHKRGSRTYHISAYREQVQNLALSMVAPSGFYSSSDMLPDLFSGNSIFNLGDYGSTGFTAGVTQDLGENVSITVMYGSTGALRAASGEVVSNSPDQLRDMIREGREQAATTQVNAHIPHSGTHVTASYQWTGGQWAVPGNLYSTQAFRPLPGLNLHFRQPIPGFGKRVEATADLRNMLAQGYLPIAAAGGQRLLLVENPRSFRGGLSFIF